LSTNSDSQSKGRPAFKATVAHRNKVRLAAAAGMSHDKIAKGLGICRDTLLKHFADELETGGAEKMLENLARLEKAAKKGNVAAMKHLDAKFKVGTAAGEVNPEPKPKTGKKEEQQTAAEGAASGDAGGWGDDLKPNIRVVK